MYLELALAVCLIIWQSQVFGGVILRDAHDGEVCESEECHETANHILKWLNPEASPCDDFYEFACGNWRNLPVNERENKSVGSRDALVKTFIPVLLNDSSLTNGNKYFEKLRNFLISCMDEDTIRSLGMTPIKQIIQKAGGWPVLDADWSEEDWDFVNAETTLGGVLINVEGSYSRGENSSFVTYLINVGPSPLIDKYTPNYEKLVEGLKNDLTKEYYDTMVYVAVGLGADKEVAEKAMLEVLEFETAFIEELVNNNFTDKKNTTLKEFQELVPWIDLTKLLQTYLPLSFELLPEENMIFKHNFFVVLEKFVNQYPTKTFVNYMISKAVNSLMGYVYHGLKICSDNNYNCMERDKEEPRFHYCTYVVSEGSMGPAMAAYLGTMYTDASKVAADMTKVIIEELLKEVGEYDWMDKVTREEAAKNISKIKIDVGFPPKIVDLNELEKLYEGYNVDSSNFFDVMVYDKKWRIQKDFDSLHKNFKIKEVLDNMGWRYYSIKGLYISAHFIASQNSIDVSGPMLRYVPLFNPGNPAYVNYGHVGTIVAHELIHAVDLNAAPRKEDLRNMERWGDNQTEHIYDQKKQCFIDFYSSFNDTKTTQLTLNGTRTQREDMADNGGLKLSLRAYRKLVDQLGSREQKLPRLQQYSAEQLFMISLANTYCEIPNKRSRIKQLAYDPHSPNDFRVKGMVMNSPDFSEIFNCDKKDPMNPPNKCEVW